MSLSRAIQEALDKRGADPGPVEAEDGGRRARVDVIEADRLGVRVRSVKVHRERPVDIVEEANALPERLRSLPERVEPVEVAPTLGGAVLRTKPEEIEDNEFYEIGVHGQDVEVRRMRAQPGHDREEVDFTLTRRQLGRLVDELE